MQAVFWAACFKVMNMNIHCSVDAKYIHKFLGACDGNWHNCTYVNCPSCKTKGICIEADFLFCVNTECIPYILPLSDAKLLFSRVPEPTECLNLMKISQFLHLYRKYLDEQHFPDGYCPCIALMRLQEAACYDW